MTDMERLADVEDELERAWAALDREEFGDWLPAIREVVLTNLRRGRHQKYTSGASGATLESYVRLVATTLRAEALRLQALAEHDDAAWQGLRQTLRLRAYLQLLNAGIDSERARERAEEFAQETCLAILQGNYPGDVPYLAWAQRILTNLILQALFRRPDPHDDPRLTRLSLDGVEPGAPLELEDPGSSAPLRQAEDRAVLAGLVDRLKHPAYRDVLAHDLAGLSDTEIALAMGRSVQAVYNLRNRALRAARRELMAGTGKGSSRRSMSAVRLSA